MTYRLCYNRLMDNKAYLDQIAVKGKKTTSKPLFTPAIIKLFAAGLVALLLFFIVIFMLNSNNAKITQKFEALYQRSASLSAEDGPLNSYNDKLKSSDLRQYNSTLQVTMANFVNTYGGMSSTAGFNPGAISSAVAGEDSTNTSEIENDLNAGYLNGLLDHTYASTAYYQVSVLITMCQEALSASTNEQLSDVINRYSLDLTELQKLYKAQLESN